MASKIRQDGRVPAGDDEELLDFMAGFPCTHVRCPGTLTEGDHPGGPAIICSVCERVYYIQTRP